LDGTGNLFAPFLDAFRRGARVVRYPASAALGYADLTAFARAALPLDERYVLLGESFSGPIAIALAAEAPPQLAGVILCCTFASNPRPGLGRLGRFIPYLPARPPLRIVEALLCGRFATVRLRAALAETLVQVSPAILRARLSAVVSVDVVKQLQSVRVPLLYLKASEDRLVPAIASAQVASGAPHVRVVELVAPHFLLQTVPQEAAVAIMQFMEEVEGAL
jgi:pimeloyl-ACP methyl ester carboxylesterase